MAPVDPLTRVPTDDPTRPSATGRTVAAWRSTLARPSTPDGDQGAQAVLADGMPSLRSATLQAHVAARTAFIDARVLAALARGTYDDRALRFRTPGVRFFELDHPATQADKRARLGSCRSPGPGPVLAPSDLRVDQVDAVLAACGHRADRSTIFVCEGLLVYLEEPVIVSVLTGLRRRAAPGSELVATAAVHADGLDPAAVVAFANRSRPDPSAEPWRTILAPDRHLELFTRSGWAEVEAVDDAVMGTGATAGRSLLVTAGTGAGAHRADGLR
jgi:methyltransferase (TIGR00027 family)